MSTDTEAVARLALMRHPRYVQSLWYAWGQQDAGIALTCDAQRFAEQHAADAVAYEAVRDYRTSTGPSYLASIAEAWRLYRAEHEQVTP